MKQLCVYCGSRPGKSPEYRAMAEQMGDAMVARGLGLVYGGGRNGLMGIIADKVLAGGGEVIGVIPEALDRRESKHTGVTQLHIVPNMHVRKAMMADHADAFVAMPGGFGTLEELFEVITWLQLGIHSKPVGLLNVAGYYDALIAMIQHAVDEQFIIERNQGLLIVDTDPDALLDKLQNFNPASISPESSGLKP